MTQVIAVDWSGRKTAAAQAIWLARVREGRIVQLENGRDREAVTAEIVERCRREPRTVVGLDFAFSFPRWYCEREGWATAREVWAAMRDRGERILATCEPPFWGRPGTMAQTLGDPYRDTERAAGAKSVFQIGGAGAVGTGTLRGMPHLLQLAEAGFSIWPFDPPGWPRVVEIYPRLFAPRIVRARLPDEHAFDAAVSALAMAQRAEELASLTQGSDIEGAIWR